MAFNRENPFFTTVRLRLCYNQSSLVLPAGARRSSGCKQAQSGSGGTGRHTILRGWRRKAWGFKSPLPHHDFVSLGGSNIAPTSRKIPKLMIYLITTIHILVCFFIIIVVLLQSGKSGDISAAFGGQGSQTACGPRGAAG